MMACVNRPFHFDEIMHTSFYKGIGVSKCKVEEKGIKGRTIFKKKH